MIKRTLHIEGMHCTHCIGLVNIELYAIKEVQNVKVDIRDQTAIVSLTKAINPIWFENAIERAGFRLKEITY